jgi:hypothetical protein
VASEPGRADNAERDGLPAARGEGNGATHHFLPIALNLLVLTVAMLSDNHVISTVSFASACLGALLIGKAFLLAEHLPMLEKHAEKPLLIATLWYSATYIAIGTCLHLAERLISAATGGQGFLFTAKEEISRFDLGFFALIQLWLVVFVLIYTFASISWRRYGRDRLSAFLLGEPDDL